jgi:hypothetical protein
MHQAEKRLQSVSEAEKAMVEALKYRFPKEKLEKKQFKLWNEEYAAAMERVYERFDKDLNVVTLYAEALMNLKPWGLWDLRTGKPAEGAE